MDRQSYAGALGCLLVSVMELLALVTVVCTLLGNAVHPAAALAACDSTYAYGFADGPTSTANRGTQGSVSVPAASNVPDVAPPHPFLNQVVWIESSDDPRSGSTEGGISYGWGNGVAAFQPFWYYYQTIDSGKSEWDDSEALAQGT